MHLLLFWWTRDYDDEGKRGGRPLVMVGRQILIFVESCWKTAQPQDSFARGSSQKSPWITRSWKIQTKMLVFGTNRNLVCSILSRRLPFTCHFSRKIWEIKSAKEVWLTRFKVDCVTCKNMPQKFKLWDLRKHKRRRTFFFLYTQAWCLTLAYTSSHHISRHNWRFVLDAAGIIQTKRH